MFSDLESFLLIPTFPSFRFFVFKHNRKHQNTEHFHNLVFRGMICSDLEYFSKHSVYLRQNFQGITQNYQYKHVNLVMKLESSFACSWSQNSIYIPKWLLFSSYLAVITITTGHFRVFVFLSWSIFENPETTENFQKLVFRGIKASYLILNTLLGIACVQDVTLKVLLKVIN